MALFRKYAPPTCAQVKAALKKAGFDCLRTKGSHEQWGKTDNGKRFIVTVDCPKAPFSNTLVESMAKQAGLSKKEFLRLCHEKKYQLDDTVLPTQIKPDIDLAD